MFYIIALEGCPYSQEAVNIINKYKNVKKIIEWVSQDKKHQYKKKLSTFPQIYFRYKKKNGTENDILIGGCDNLKKILQILNYIQNLNPNQDPLTPILPMAYLASHI